MSNLESGESYVFVNRLARTVMDLSGEDNYTVIGYPPNGGDNQKWTLQRGEHWTIRNVATGKFLAVQGGPRDGAPLIAIDEPVPWDIYDDEDGSYRIFVPGSPVPINIDLADHGNAQPGTAITLWGKWEGKNQTWFLERA